MASTAASGASPPSRTSVRQVKKLSARPLMHGPSFAGDGAAALRALAGDYDRRVRAACADAMPAVAERPSAARPAAAA
jgi:hypothetical protein